MLQLHTDRRGKTRPLELSWLQPCKRGIHLQDRTSPCDEDSNWERLLLQELCFAAAVRGDPQLKQSQPQLVTTEGVPEQAAVPPQSAQQQSQPLTAPCTAGSSLDNVLRVTTTVQEIMTTVNVAESEEENIVAITKIVGVRVHRSLKVIACNANGT